MTVECFITLKSQRIFLLALYKILFQNPYCKILTVLIGRAFASGLFLPALFLFEKKFFGLGQAHKFGSCQRVNIGISQSVALVIYLFHFTRLVHFQIRSIPLLDLLFLILIVLSTCCRVSSHHFENGFDSRTGSVVFGISTGRSSVLFVFDSTDFQSLLGDVRSVHQSRLDFWLEEIIFRFCN